ncbi:hypothetical protein Q8F55_000051 [Vanrija albida]|uniref:Uncharacterized protein n=1 Tax=Vanrija albida TaxID=181172 RepID=A0ABR3QCR8_9TREE
MGVQLPPGARRLVLHIQYDAVPQWRRAGVTVDGDVRDFVFVFWPEKPHASERVPTASWLFHCFYNVLPMGQEFSVTVVGLERVLAPAVNAADVPAAWFEASRPQIRAHCLDRYPRLRQSKAGLAWVDAVFARTRFVEIDEWTTELGERQHIEGRWSEPRRGPMDVRREEQEARAAAHHVEEMW